MNRRGFFGLLVALPLASMVDVGFVDTVGQFWRHTHSKGNIHYFMPAKKPKFVVKPPFCVSEFTDLPYGKMLLKPGVPLDQYQLSWAYDLS